VALPGAPAAARACCPPWSRLSLLLAGELRTVICRGEAVHEEVQRPGDALFYLPRGWNYHHYPATYGQMGVVFRPGYVRLHYTEAAAHPQVPGGPDWWYHTSRPAGSQTRQTLGALEALARNGGDAETGRLLVLALLRLCREEVRQDPSAEDGQSAGRTFQHVQDYVHENFQHPINRDTAARALGLHPNYLSRLFRRQAGETFVACLRRLRLEHAARLLGETDLPVAEVGRRSGFGHPSHFHRTFRRHYGESPGVYRHRAGSATARA
jgi:AraC-like DNA-binding protein